MLLKIKTYLFATILIILAIFTLQNLASVEVNFLFWSTAIPRALLIVVLLMIGALLGWLLGISSKLSESP